MKNGFAKNVILFLIPFFLIVIIFVLPLFKTGLIVGGDWTFPSSNNQLNYFAEESQSLWWYREIPTGSQMPNQNMYPIQILMKGWAALGFDGISFQKISLILTIFGIYFFSFKLFKYITKNNIVSIVGSLSYIFSPIIFNYINMGWNYVLLFYALSPLFTLISLKYLKEGGIIRPITLGYICAISFVQAQAIVWFPIIYILVFLSQTFKGNLKQNIVRLITGLISMLLITLSIHAAWIIPILLKLNTSIDSTTTFDVSRFSSVSSLFNSFRGWGSLYNIQFEIAYPEKLLLFSFFPVALIIYGIIVSKNLHKQKLLCLAISLILIAPFIFIFRHEIASIPYSSIVRDSSRFLVLTSLGLSLGITIAISSIKNNKIFLIIVGLALSSYPFFSGKLFSMPDNYVSSTNDYKDFRIRFLTLPDENLGNMLDKYKDQNNIYLPTGGFLFTNTDNNYNREFWGISDIYSRFSTYGTGIYISDKSNSIVTKFALMYLNEASKLNNLKEVSRIYGIDNLFYRKGLKSTFTMPLDIDNLNTKCVAQKYGSSDFSVSSICPIDKPYPIIYTSVTPVYGSIPVTTLTSKEKMLPHPAVILNCPNDSSNKDQKCNKYQQYKLSKEAPNIKFIKISSTKYIVDVDSKSDTYILVLNQTFHPGWIISDVNGIKQNYSHIIVNQYVNGWVINASNTSNINRLVITFYPQTIYAIILPISTGILVLITGLLFISCMRNHQYGKK